MTSVGKMMNMNVEGSGGSWLVSAGNFYVATTGNDTTGDGSSGNPWATVGKAITYLNDYRLSASQTINVAAGAYTESTLTISHPDGIYIKIVGPAYVSKDILSIQSSSGSSGDRSIILNMSSVSDVSIGDFIRVFGAAGGSNPNVINGIHEITNVDAINTRITIRDYNYYSSAPSGAVAVSSVPIAKARLNFNGGTGIDISSNVNGLLTRIILVNTGTQASSYGIKDTSPMGYSGLVASGGGMSNWDNGIQLAYGKLNVATCLISHCAIGAWVSHGGVLNISGGDFITGCSSYGLCATNRATIIYSSNYLMCNVNAITANMGGYIDVSSSIIANNTTTALFAEHGGFIFAVNAVNTANGTWANPTVNTVGNDNSYIDT